MERLGNECIKDGCEGWDCFHHIAHLQGLLLCGVLFPYSLVYLIEISGIYWRIFWIDNLIGRVDFWCKFVLRVRKFR